MHGTNPYAQAGWYNPANPHTINTQTWGISALSGPSVFGALPLPASQSSLPTILSFHYVTMKPNVLNCMITGPTSIPYLEVSSSGTQTVFRRPDGQTMASLDWTGPSPTVEVPSLLSKRPVSSWIKRSTDGTYHSITVNNREYMWTSHRDNNAICLAAFGELMKGPLVRIYPLGQAITLEVTTEAFHLGLLEPAVIAVVLFHSGMKFE